MCARYFIKHYGKHRPVCGGTLLVATTGWDNLLPVTGAMIVGPTVVWFVCVAPTVVETMTVAMPILVAIFSSSTLLFMILTWITEPGIIPTVTYEDENGPTSAPTYRSYVYINNTHYDLVQFRAKFSRYTENCIEKFDHYCPWVGNAVGKRNYRYFVFFVVSVLALATTITTCTVTLMVQRIVNDRESFSDAVSELFAPILLGVYAVVMFVSLMGLCGFHLVAISRNLTTNEYLKRVYTINNPNPYDRGCLNNYYAFFTTPLPRSRVAIQDHTSPLLASDDENLDLLSPAHLHQVQPVFSPVQSTQEPMEREQSSSAEDTSLSRYL